MEQKTEQDIDVLLAKFMAGEATSEERDFLLNWKNANVQNQKIFEQSESLWKKAFDLPPQSFNADRAWNKIEPVLESSSLPTQETKKVKFRIGAPWYAAAAAGILAFLFYFNLNSEQAKTFKYAANQIDTVQLPDNSTIILAKNSSVSYNYDGKKRNVELSGNAYFKVAKDQQHPFIISTKLGAIEVVGTSFDVIENSDTLTVLVNTGKVKVAPSISDLDTVAEIYTANQKAQAVGNKVIKSKVEETDKFWRTKQLRFNNATISKVLNDLAKAYDIQIESKLTNDTCRITGKYDNLDVDQILKSLQELYAIEYQKSGDKWIIESSSCQ